MSDNPTEPTQVPEPQQSVSPSPTQAQNSENMIPQSRFNTVIEERNTFRDQLEALQQAQRNAQEQELADQNRFKELYQQAQQQLTQLQESHQHVQKRIDSYMESLSATNTARLERIPEDRRALVPLFEGENAAFQLSAWLDKSEAFLLENPRPTPPKIDAGAGTISQPTGTDKLTPQEQAMARAFNMSDEEYVKYKNMTGDVPQSLGGNIP